ncbi:MAG TPA: ATP-binding protein [Deltaproteobacteria bacterium]|nr:ATP-binding protein [Deltaproteobacteria bacterium]HPR56082.1 ATP-binding protein [Deltaproteobacteria bacterium]HXK48651.1 ATP-binding protein [Deltaproteobacteria bacterium]
MRRPIFFKIFAGFLAVTVTLAVLILGTSYEVIRSHYLRSTAQNLQSIGTPLRDVIAPVFARGEAEALNSLARQYDRQLDVRITIIDAAGRVLADSERDPATLENHGHRPEMVQALQGRTGRSIRYSKTLDQDLLYIALPVERQGRIVGVLRLSMTLGHIDELLHSLLKRLFGLTAVIIVLSLALSAFFSHLISSPIRALSRAARSVAGGDLSVRVSPSTDDEIRDLTESFNDMAGKLEFSFSELRTRKEELESILSSITEVLLVLDPEGKVLLYNQAAQKIIPAGTILGRYHWELLRSTKLNDLVRDALEGSVSGEVELLEKTYLCSITQLASRRDRIVILHDISDMKQIERVKKDLVVNVSHELRTPLTAIKGFAETCLDEADGAMREHLKIILRHTDRLIAMVNDLLTLSEIEEKSRLAVEDMSVKDLIGNVLAAYEPRIRGKGLDLKVESPEFTIKADPFRLEQLLTNLVDNALKYTEKGWISIHAEHTAQAAVITVSDTGVGIPREHLGRIFERFYVVDKSRSRNMGGTGLGLAIAKHIAALHGGMIEVRSTPYSGTSFRVTIPTKD